MTLDERLDLIERITGERITLAERMQRHREAARFSDPDEGDGE